MTGHSFFKQTSTGRHELGSFRKTTPRPSPSQASAQAKIVHSGAQRCTKAGRSQGRQFAFSTYLIRVHSRAFVAQCFRGFPAPPQIGFDPPKARPKNCALHAQKRTTTLRFFNSRSCAFIRGPMFFLPAEKPIALREITYDPGPNHAEQSPMNIAFPKADRP
jgi:hypothetical protein